MTGAAGSTASTISRPGSPVRRAALWAGLAACTLGCGRERLPARVGIAVEVGWYPAVRLALEDLGDAPLEIVADSTRNVQMAASAIAYAEWLADSGVVAVVGHSGSRGSVAASTVYGRRGIVQVAPISTSRELTQSTPGAYALVPDDSSEGAFIAAYVDTVLRARRVALLYHHDEYGLGIRDGVVAELARRGITPVDERFFAPEGTPSGSLRVERLLSAALRSQPDVIVLGARVAETRDVAAYLRRRRLRIPVVCGDGSLVLPPNPADRDLRDLEGMRIVWFWAPDRDSASAAFATRFTRRTGYAPGMADAFTYDAVMLVGTAARAGARTPGQFRRFLDLTRFRGVAGEYSFSRGRPVDAPIEMVMVRAGTLGVASGGSP